MVYLSRKRLKRHNKNGREILNELSSNLGDAWSIKFNLVGSASRNLVIPSNDGFDFDYHIHLNKYPKSMTPKEIKNKLRVELDKIMKNHNFSPCEDSTHVLTSKKEDQSKIIFSYDFAILRKNGQKVEILKNRKNGTLDDYQFVQVPDYPKYIKNLKKINDPKHVEFLRNRYYDLKTSESQKKKDDRTLSISLLLIAINETIQKYKLK
jgi:uncharacterized membrane protein